MHFHFNQINILECLKEQRQSIQSFDKFKHSSTNPCCVIVRPHCMDKLHSQGSWSGCSLSVPHIRSGQSFAFPFAAHFASSTLTTSSGPTANNKSSDTSSLGAPQPNPELEEFFARMRKLLENEKWEPEDSKALLSLLDEGRFCFFVFYVV